MKFAGREMRMRLIQLALLSCASAPAACQVLLPPHLIESGDAVEVLDRHMKRRDKGVAELLRELSEGTNQQLPADFSSWKIVRTTAGPGARFAYWATTTPYASQRNGLRTAEFAREWRETGCLLPGMPELLRRNVRVSWHFTIEGESQPAVSIHLRKRDCVG